LEDMKETGSPKLLFENLDSTPIHPTLWKAPHRHGPGRPAKYNPEWDLKALMLRQLLRAPYMKDLVQHLKRNPCLRKVCGYGDKAPTEARAAGELGATIIPADQEDGEKARRGVLSILEEGANEMWPSGSGVLPAFETVGEIDSWLLDQGYDVKHETEKYALEKLEYGGLSSVICPPRIEKRHIIDIAKAGKLFTFKATRHIIPARPLGPTSRSPTSKIRISALKRLTGSSWNF
jgi:hypothetical protein